MLAVGTGNSVTLWDTANRKVLPELRGRAQAINAITFSPDGTLASAGTSGIVELWIPGERKNLGVLDCGSDFLLSLAFSPDGGFWPSQGTTAESGFGM
jgi:WD40 repeat protein